MHRTLGKLRKVGGNSSKRVWCFAHEHLDVMPKWSDGENGNKGHLDELGRLRW